ncbi:SDR family NAD(P)-dependent oxidoreductase [Acinetobacter junii]|uniref:SDR family NAD(P)-dependent oxidoreductase n=1 Tax=Acinetobacter junii TaxID=40215 RepID=UPI003A875E34
MIKKVRRVSPLIAICMACSFIPTVTLANTFPYEESGNIRVDTINVSLINPTQDQTLNQRIMDQIRKDIAIFPGEIVSAERLDFIITRVRNTLRLDSLSYDAETSMGGGLNLTLKATLNDKQSLTQKGYLIDKNKKTLPLLYDSNGKYLKAKLELLSMYYANNNAWYAQPGKMLNGNPLVDGNPAYVASKHAVTGLTKNAAIDYAPYGIRVNSVNMAATETAMTDAAFKKVATLQKERAKNPVLAKMPNTAMLKTQSLLMFADSKHRMSTTAEQASVILFLLSDEASNITGATWATDGGWTTF